MTDKQMIKKLAERYKEICKNPFADGYTFKAFEGRCAEQGFIIDDVRNYIKKEKQERKVKRAESIKSLKEQLKRKEQECEELKEKVKELRQGWINCDKERNLQEANSEFRRRIIDRHEQKLEKIRQICNCSKDKMNCDECPMCDECEELCVNNKNLQDIILRIIDEVRNE